MYIIVSSTVYLESSVLYFCGIDPANIVVGLSASKSQMFLGVSLDFSLLLRLIII